MASFFSRTNKNGTKVYGFLYYDEHGIRRSLTVGPDRGVCRQVANKTESDVALRKAGIIDAAEARRIEEAKKPLAITTTVQRKTTRGMRTDTVLDGGHLQDWRDALYDSF